MSPLLSGFRKGYSTQHALLLFLHNIQRQVDEGKNAAAVLMDLSKAFDCMDHSLLLAKLHAYGLSKNALLLIRSYLSNRKQRVGLDHEYSSWLDLEIGVPQGSILGPLLFNLFINDLLLSYTEKDVEICNYADDNTLYASGKSLTEIKLKLTNSLMFVSSWFSKNGFKLNADKCKLIVFGKPRDSLFQLEFNNQTLTECDSVKLLGIVIDNQLNFRGHIDKLCKRANGKLSALQRISSFLPFEKRKAIADSFVAAETSYCPLIWSFRNRSSLRKVERINERAHSLIYQDETANSKTMHRHYCEILLKEVFKTKFALNPSYMQNVFGFRDNCRYDLRSGSSIIRNRIRTTKHGLQSISHIGAQLWDSLPHAVKSYTSLNSFCREVRGLPFLNCTCRLCADFIPNLGYC